MSAHNTNAIKNGMKLMIDSAPCLVLDVDLVKPGKGQAFTRIKYRNLINGRVVERTWKANEFIDGADVVERNLRYMYSDGEQWHVMDEQSFEQYAVDAGTIGDTARWLREQDEVSVLLWNGHPIAVTPPNFVELIVSETEPGFRGDTASGATKSAQLETGATIKVPLFVTIGERVRIDTRSGEYVSRVKSG